MNLRLNKKTKIIVFLVSAGSILLSLPFLFPGFGILMLVALVPILFLERFISENKTKGGWFYVYLTFILWNSFTTYWIAYANFKGAVGAILLYSLGVTLVVRVYSWFRKRTNNAIGYSFLILGWIAFEHLLAEGEIAWPWLALGNGFATSYKVVQWYEFTGVFGGTLWALVVSVFVFDLVSKIINSSISEKTIKIRYSLLALVIILPAFISHLIYAGYKEKPEPKNFLIVQPNIDPYHDKFGGMTQKEQDERLLSLVNKGVTDSTLFVVAPETFSSGIIENEPYSSDSFKRFAEIVRRNKNVNLIFGASTYFMYPKEKFSGEHRPNYTARRINGGWYESYNTAIYMDSSERIMFYHKSKLVPLVEYLPYPKYLGGFKMFVIELGGNFGSYGTQKERSVYKSHDSTTVIGTAICYESVYGNYYREYVLNGATVMAVITNDGWWLDSPGYTQHLYFDQLRAIETRRSIARCGNTGVSAFINQRGDIVARTEWWKPGLLSGQLNLNSKITTFVKYGDYIGRISFASMFLFLGLAILTLLKISVKGKE
ncbi:MAG TPA: apolipoprotein N-acyltransferase [Bacteroidales bacterium]|nr:apolipoprotein N-acyltransferase [Bacteroidales bacterium]